MNRRTRSTAVLPLALLAVALVPGLAGCRGVVVDQPPGGDALGDNVVHLRLEGTEHRSVGPVRVVGDDLTALGVASAPDLPPVAHRSIRLGFVVLGCRPDGPAALVVDEHHGLLGATFPNAVDGDVVCDTPQYYAEVFDVPTAVLERSGVTLDDGRHGR